MLLDKYFKTVGEGYSQRKIPNIPKMFMHFGIPFIILCILWMSFVIIRPGTRGVLVTLGAVQEETWDEGLHMKIPFMQKIKRINVQTQKIEAPADGASKDLQDVQTTIALNFHVDPSAASTLYQTVGRDYVSRIIAPAIEESVKASTALFTAEELIKRRVEVREATQKSIKERLEQYNIIVDSFSIINFQFSASFDRAIEAKVTAEQQALEEQNRLKQIEFQAQQKIVQATAEAEAIRIRGAALSENPKLVELEAVEKWDGVLPVYQLGGATPFINIPN